ncbi:MAG: hypothetical protein NTV62_02845 [Candidatus Gribaldobacteria bacterium]|nr:hypothetical protein [Candidatus Gribaldobacteria bacterium]
MKKELIGLLALLASAEPIYLALTIVFLTVDAVVTPFALLAWPFAGHYPYWARLCLSRAFDWFMVVHSGLEEGCVPYKYGT